MKNIQHDILEEYLDLQDLFTFRIMTSSKHFSFSVLSGPTSFLFSRAVCLSLLGRFKCRCLLLSNLLVCLYLSFFLPLIVGQIQTIGVSIFLISWFHSVCVFAWFQN